MGAKRPVGNAGGHPHSAQNQRRATEMEPDEAANQESEARNYQSTEISAFLMAPMVDEGRRIDAHEGDERAEIERLCADFIGPSPKSPGEELEHPGSHKRKRSDCHDVVAGDSALGLDCPEEGFGKRISPSHAIQEPAGGELRAHPGTHVCHQQREVDDLEENGATGLAREQGKGRLNLIALEWLGSPDELGRINFKS